VKLCVDVNLFYDRQSEDYVREAVRQCCEHLVYTHYGAWNFSEAPDGEVIQDPAPSFGGKINYEAFISALHQIGYNGYLVSEYCTPVLKHHSIAGIEEIDRGTRLALRYVKRLVEQASSATTNSQLPTANSQKVLERVG
jgi:sugar phosphate isomerase/epimerase